MISKIDVVGGVLSFSLVLAAQQGSFGRVEQREVEACPDPDAREGDIPGTQQPSNYGRDQTVKTIVWFESSPAPRGRRSSSSSRACCSASALLRLALSV